MNNFFSGKIEYVIDKEVRGMNLQSANRYFQVNSETKMMHHYKNGISEHVFLDSNNKVVKKTIIDRINGVIRFEFEQSYEEKRLENRMYDLRKSELVEHCAFINGVICDKIIFSMSNVLTPMDLIQVSYFFPSKVEEKLNMDYSFFRGSKFLSEDILYSYMDSFPLKITNKEKGYIYNQTAVNIEIA